MTNQLSHDSITGLDPKTGQGITVDFNHSGITAINACDYAGTQWLSAGLVDLQVNGYGGFDLNSHQIDTECVLQLARILLRCGVTTFLPTVITASDARIGNAVKTIALARSKHSLLQQMIPGIHVEGPYIAPEDGPRGAHPLSQVQPPDLQQFNRWQQQCGGIISLLTVSPHWPDIDKFIRAVKQQGVVVSIGHTAASHQQITEAVDAGATMSTHLGNGIAAMLPRHLNPIWPQLAEDRLMASFIADSFHLPAAVLKSMFRAKGVARSILVSDVADPGGLAPGLYKKAIGGEVLLEENGRLSINGTQYLAGAALPLSNCVASAATLTGISLDESLQMATANAGHIIGRSARLAAGDAADIIAFDWTSGDMNLALNTVIKGGQQVDLD